jgi:hypothetical protein
VFVSNTFDRKLNKSASSVPTSETSVYFKETIRLYVPEGCHLIYCNVLGGSIHDGTLLQHQKSIHYSQTQSATLRTHVHVRPVRSRNTHSYRILPTGPLVAIFQHSLPFLQSESFQTHVETIHRRAIGPLALHNGTSAICLPRRSNVFTVHRINSRAPLTISRYELNLPTKRSP